MKLDWDSRLAKLIGADAPELTPPSDSLFVLYVVHVKHSRRNHEKHKSTAPLRRSVRKE